MIKLEYRIKEIREKSGMNPSDLAKKSGVSRATIWAIETGVQDVTTTKTLVKIAEALDTTVDALFATDPRTA